MKRKPKNQRLKTRQGFTLAELIVVIVILGILAGLATPVYLGYLQESDRRVMDMRASALNAAKKTLIMRQPDPGFETNSKSFNSLVPYLSAEFPNEWGTFSKGDYYELSDDGINDATEAVRSSN